MKRKPMHPLFRLRKIIRECEELIATVEWWNTNRTDEAPCDCEIERVILAKAVECRAAWGDPQKYTRLAGEMSDYALQVRKNSPG